MVINSVPDACFTPAKKNPNPQEVQTSREDKKEVTRHEKDSKSHGTQRVMTLHLFGGAGKYRKIHSTESMSFKSR